MLFNWIGACMIYCLIQYFIKYMPGSLFVNNEISACSAFFNMFQGQITGRLGTNRSLKYGFILTAIASTCLNFFDS